MKQKISAVIVAKDEADRIGETIKAVAFFCDEVLVVDTGSKDDTIGVSERNGARVESLIWEGYGTTKNASNKLAKYNWVLSLDADEVVSKSLAQSILGLKLNAESVYVLNRIIKYKGKLIRHGGLHPDFVYRLFHRKHCHWNDNLVHEKLVYPKGTAVEKLNGHLIHHSYLSKEHFTEKIDLYARLTAQGWLATDTGPGILKRLFGPQWKYISMYYFKSGYRDGKEGKEMALVHADGVRKKLLYYDQFLKEK